MNKKKIVVNATTLVMGGAIQSCVNFIIESLKDDSLCWHYLVSSKVYEQLDRCSVDVDSINLTIIPQSPARNIISRLRIKKIVTSIDADAVFTFFGPSYVDFECMHILGFADPWVLNPNDYAQSILNTFFQKLHSYILCSYKRKWLRRADVWIVETDAAKRGVIRCVNCQAARVHVVPNGCRDVFRSIAAKSISEIGSEIRVLTISAYYPHKRFELIPQVAAELKALSGHLNVKFIITLDKSSPPAVDIYKNATQLGVADLIDFVGSVSLDHVPDLYKSCHVAFIPTVLEVFSAAYSEAMACKMPIVTSDLDFARSVCQGGAYYFNPNDAALAASELSESIVNEERRVRVVSIAKKLSDELPAANKKYEAYKKVLINNLRR